MSSGNLYSIGSCFFSKLGLVFKSIHIKVLSHEIYPILNHFKDTSSFIFDAFYLAYPLSWSLNLHLFTLLKLNAEYNCPHEEE